MTENRGPSAGPPEAPVVSRRRLLIGAGATAGTAALASALARRSSLAQVAQGIATPNALGPALPPELSQYANDWPTVQANIRATRAAANASINSSNVSKLRVAWTMPIAATGPFGGMTATPLIAGSTVYVQDMMSNVFALDRNTGKATWQKTYNVPTTGPNGLALGYGMLYGTTGDTAEIFALDIKSGQEVWSVKLTSNTAESIDMAPIAYGNTVYVSTNPGTTKVYYRGGTKGVLFALDAKTGTILWSFDTTTDNLWGNPRVNTGGSLWYPPSFDDQGNLYFGTGNPGPWPGVPGYPNGSSRPGPDDYASCMVSLDGKTGGVRWYINAAPHDLFDHDFQQTPILANLTLPGASAPTLVAIGGGKTGTVIAADATTGEELWRAAVGQHNGNDTLQAVPPGKTITVLPGAGGGVESPMAYADGTVFAAVLNFPTSFTSTGTAPGPGFEVATGELVALNAVDGTVKWDVKLPTGVVGAATVANDVVFTSGLDGVFRAYKTADGSPLWSYQAQAGFNAPPAVAGDMVVVAAAGPYYPRTAAAPAAATPGGAAGVKPTATPKPVQQLIAFKLGS